MLGLTKKGKKILILPPQSDSECYVSWEWREDILQTGEERVVIYLIGFKPLAPENIVPVMQNAD